VSQDATCKAHLKTFESVGCCMKSYMDAVLGIGDIDENENLERMQQASLLFTSAGIVFPDACSLDALEAEAVVTLDGISYDECVTHQSE
jgi:hypothetical protein